jgi:hypothetical protein
VDCRAVGDGAPALIYLGRYLYRGVVQEKDIIKCDQHHVTFRYRDSTTNKMTLRTVTGATSLWLLLQHVLPKGFDAPETTASYTPTASASSRFSSSSSSR